MKCCASDGGGNNRQRNVLEEVAMEGPCECWCGNHHCQGVLWKGTTLKTRYIERADMLIITNETLHSIADEETITWKTPDGNVDEETNGL